jgi:hypothetical protein
MVGKKVTSSLFRIVARLEWIMATDKADMSSVRCELEMKSWVSPSY